MKRIATALFTLSVVLLAATGSATTPNSIQVTRNLTSMPLAFTANHGQWDEQVLYRANAGGATMWFTKDGAVYQFTRTIKSEDDGPFSIVDKRYGMMPDDMMDHQPDSIESIAIKATFVGANPNPQMTGLDAMEYKCNYFIGNDPNEWHTDVPNYQAIIYEDIYTGIDLKYYGNGIQMEYDFIVSSGADYSQIKIQYEGAESISIDADGELVVETTWGEVVEQRPVIYQIENGSRIAIAGEYRLKGDNTFGFELGSNYDPTLPLVIDPVLVYSTYLGGSSDDRGYGIAVDGSGNAYITGYTWSTNFPTEGESQTFQGDRDAFVTKLNSSGNDLVYSTYLGGNNTDVGRGIAVDGFGNAYVTGETGSTNFPTEGEYQTDQGEVDAFVTKLNSSGNGLVYSTYLGGSIDDYGYGIAVDGSGNAYITGHTESINFPTEGAYQATHQGGTYDAFVTKLNSSGNDLVYSTYLGGSRSDHGRGIAVNGSGNAYITGLTSSTGFPVEGEYQTFQGYYDAFVTKLNSSGNGLVYSTYLGGSIDDFGWGIAMDGSGNAYITGYTTSINFPTTPDAYDTSYNGGNFDAFVMKLSADSTYITITAPTAGTEWLVGTAHNIEWYSVGDVGNVTIYWSRDNFVSDSTPVVHNWAGPSPYNWSVPSNSASSTVTFRVYGNNDNVYATSEEMIFSGVVVTFPVSGNLAQGATTSITWDVIGTLVGPSVDVEYMYVISGNPSSWVRLASFVPNMGFWPWSPIPPPPAEQVWIRVKKAGTMTGIGLGGPFSISGLIVVAPNGGECWAVGSIYDIRWNVINPTDVGNVTIALYRDPGADLVSTLVTGLDGALETFSWTIPSGLAAHTMYYIKLASDAIPTIMDFSNAYFEIRSGGSCCTYWTAGLDTVLYTAFEVELFDPTDSTGSLGSIVAFGADMLVQRSEPYEDSSDIWRMDTDILAFSGSGESPLMGGAFTIDLNPQESSGGFIQMCDSCNNNWAESHFTINYRINTSLPYPNNMYYGLALMDLPCDEQWDPLPPGDEPFTPPNGHDYNDPRKLPIINANGDTVGYTTKQHSVDEVPFGSCCVLETSQDYVTSACLIVTEVDCDSAGGVYYGDNSICDPDGEDYDLDGIGDSCDQCDDFPPIIQNPVGDTLWVEFSAPSFAYYPVITDPDNVSHTITYTEYPSYWCWLSGDSVVAGEVPDTVIVERLTVVVEDTCNVTTRSFIVGIYLCGDFNEDGVLDISDLVYLIDYMFNGGPPPPVLAAGDVDGDGEDINISDLVYMIDYMFIGGEPPICP